MVDQEKLLSVLTSLLQKQDKRIELLEQALKQNASTPGTSHTNSEMVLDSFANSMREFSHDPDNGITFENWYARYDDVFTAAKKQLDDKDVTRLVLRKLDQKSHSKYINYILPQTTKDYTLDQTIETLGKIFGLHTSVFSRRYNCLQIKKSDDDDYVTYAGAVNRGCEEFKFTELGVEQFKCLIFISGLHSHKDFDIRARLLQKLEAHTASSPVTLHSLVSECQRVIALKLETSLVEQSAETKINKIHQQKHTHKKPQETKEKEMIKPKYPCWNCGAMHFAKDCGYQKHFCTECKEQGHKEGYCSSARKSKTSGDKNKGKKNFRKKSNKHNTESKVVVSVNQIRFPEKRKFVKVYINNRETTLQIDTASDITIISQEQWHALGEPQTKQTKFSAKDASGDLLELTEEFDCNITINGITKQGTCYVTTVPDLNLFGIDWIELFDLWSKPIDNWCRTVKSIEPDNRSIQIHINQLVQKFPEVFKSELGLCNKTKIKLHLKPDAQPVYKQKRPVPYAAQLKIDEELQRLQEAGIIESINFSEWAAPIVVVKKPNGKIRICADYSTGLNKSLEANSHPLPSPDDIFSKLSGKQIFSIIDFSDAYFQLQVEENSQMLLTINTHQGLFKYKRLPFGVKTAPGAFQQVIDAMITDLPFTSAYLDDIIISSETIEEHLQHLIKLIQRIKEYGFVVRADKCQFFTKTVKFLGHIIDKDGLQPDPEKIKHIKEMPAPANVNELRSFLGAVNYYGKFVHKMQQIRSPLDQLLHKDKSWNWTQACQNAFEKFKEILQSQLLLTHFNPALPIVVAADACNTGIGAVIFHEFENGHRKAIYHAARTLTTTEQKYSQIEKEALALIYAVTKFHKFISGRRFILETDHKPLLHILGSKKGIPVYTANRLQRWSCTLLLYDFEIKYVSTESFGYADVLSRLISSKIQPDEEFVIAVVQFEAGINQIHNEAISSSPVDFKKIKQESESDNTIQEVIAYLNNGWPTDKKKINQELRPFFNRKESLCVIKNCLMFGERIVAPKILHKRILRELHKGHPGMERMKSVARSYVYWAYIDTDIEKFVRECEKCAITKKSPIKTFLQSWPVPDNPWDRIHIDYAGPFSNHYFLVIVDAKSKWPEIFITKSITATETIKFIKNICSRFGLPKIIVSDNGTQFISNLFEKFCTENGIEHFTSPPYHPQSNGQAEIFVDTFKRGMKKINSGEGLEETLNTFLTTYRYTPNKMLEGKSPAEIMLGRKVRTTLDLMHPQQNTGNHVQHKQNQQYNNQHGAINRKFDINDLVYAKVYSNNEWEWSPGIIIERQGKVMYKIKLSSGKIIRSHTNQLIHRYENKTAKEDNKTSLPFEMLIEEFQENPVIPPAEEIGIEGITTPPSSPIQQPLTIRDRPPRTIRRPLHFADYELY